MDEAHAALASGPLMGKLAEVIREMSERVQAETGTRPLYVKVCLQMPDDSALEVRAELCPDGCGQLSLVPAAVPRLCSGHDS